MHRWLFGGALLALGVSSPAAAQETGDGDAAAGQELAQQLCTGCHIVGTENAGTDVAPPFPEIATDPERTLSELHAWPGAPHPVIPDLALGPEHIADINAYLESLRTAAAEPEEVLDEEPPPLEEVAPPMEEAPERPEGAAPRIEDEEPPPAILESPPEEVGPPIEPQPELGPTPGQSPD